MRRSPLLALLLPFAIAAAPVARVLEEDPPLPGEPMTGWEALDPATPATVLDLDDAVALALESTPELASLRAEVSAARGALLDARGFPNPTWEVDVLAIAADHTTTVPANFEVALDVSDLVHARLAGAAVKPEVEAARLRLAEETLRIAYETKAAYYDHQAALTAWAAALRSVDALAAARDAQRAIGAAGNAPARDIAVKETAYEDARLEAAELEVDVVASRERLTRLIRRDPGPLSPPTLPALAIPENVEATAIANSLALHATDASIQAAQRARTAAQVEAFAPDVGVFFESERRRAEWEAVAGLELSVPLFSFGRGEILRAGSERDRLVAERARIDRDVRSAARETEARLISAHRRARHVEEILVPARERVLQETLLHYNAMQVGLDELLAAWRGRTAIEATLADTRREALTAAAALDALLQGARVDPARAARSASIATASSGGH